MEKAACSSFPRKTAHGRERYCIVSAGRRTDGVPDLASLLWTGQAIYSESVGAERTSASKGPAAASSMSYHRRQAEVGKKPFFMTSRADPTATTRQQASFLIKLGTFTA